MADYREHIPDTLPPLERCPHYQLPYYYKLYLSKPIKRSTVEKNLQKILGT